MSEKYESPVAELEWVTYEGEGKENMSGTFQYLATVLLEGKAAEAEKAKIDAFWNDNKPKGLKAPKSTGYYVHRVPVMDDATGKQKVELDEDGDEVKVYKETGKTAFSFKTGISYKDGGIKKIPIFNAKGVEVDLRGKKIGNGSVGRIQGAMDVYKVNSPKGLVIDGGVTLYLNGIQLAKFVEFSGGVQFGGIEGDFDGAVDGGMTPIDQSENVSNTDASDKVKL